jgi:hypothetical protein
MTDPYADLREILTAEFWTLHLMSYSQLAGSIRALLADRDALAAEVERLTSPPFKCASGQPCILAGVEPSPEDYARAQQVILERRGIKPKEQ